jgi:hypothetical protein
MAGTRQAGTSSDSQTASGLQAITELSPRGPSKLRHSRNALSGFFNQAARRAGDAEPEQRSAELTPETNPGSGVRSNAYGRPRHAQAFLAKPR